MLIVCRDVLLPLVKEFDEGVEEAANGIQDCLSQTDSLVDDAALNNRRASKQLARIQERRLSLTGTIHHAILSILNPRSSLFASEQQVHEVFLESNAKLITSTANVITKYTTVRGHLNALKDTLTLIAMGFKEDEYDLQKEKLGEASYWKIILKSHRHKMKDFDMRMELCASFYNYALKASQVITATNYKLLDVRYQLLQFKSQLSAAPEAIERGDLEATIEKLNTSISDLQESKRESKKMQKARIADFHKLISK